MANEVHYGKCGSDEDREGALAVKWYDQSYEPRGGGGGGWGGGCQVVRLTRVVQVHLISDIIHLYVINYSLKFCNYYFVLFVMRVYLPPS